ncbi:hypothetical protein QAD02_018097 [Eretmocerus hayati]|uniref:Uncharacterized protein n=1 Tax=Eretmocerus hayati TaxID=131215 RepID=A0ACC2PKK8_9HYME|nr:hypothetical protein QAD02_018097 [Eretmocerus hayati]
MEDIKVLESNTVEQFEGLKLHNGKNNDPRDFRIQLNDLDFHHVFTINLSHNCLSEVPDSLADLKNLESLDLSDNELVDLPMSLAKLHRLKVLDISKNKFKAIPKCVHLGMGTLKSLNVSDNEKIKLNVIPYSKYIETFLASRNRNCAKFPDWLVSEKFFNLKEFCLDKTQFDVFSFVGKKGDLNLRVVSMACSNLSSPVLKMLIENMFKLEKLDLGNDDTLVTGNIFTHVPMDAIRNPALITELSLRATTIPTVSADIKKLCNLKKLDLGLNCISWLPDEFCELAHLETLNIDGNGLIMLPDNIGDLKSLQYLRLEKNALMRLPESFKNLKNLKFADIYNNQIQEFPHSLSEMIQLQGLDLDFNYFDTSEIKIGDTPYSVLRVNITSGIGTSGIESRCSGFKIQETPVNDDHDDYSHYGGYNSCASDDDREDSTVYTRSESRADENWDESTDSDDEFDPNEILEVNYNEQSKRYYPPGALGFCPDDLHSERIKAEVASLRAHGSLPTYTIEAGQFDDAD